jgi:hypothetical protein
MAQQSLVAIQTGYKVLCLKLFVLCSANSHLLLQEIWDSYVSEDQHIYLNFNVVLSDVSAFLVDGDYHWNETSNEINLLPVIDKCGIALKLQQVNSTVSNPPHTNN